MLVMNDVNNLHCSLINEERFRHRSGRENTNIERCTKNLSRGGKKDKQKDKVDWKQSEEGRVSTKTERAEKHLLSVI